MSFRRLGTFLASPKSVELDILEEMTIDARLSSCLTGVFFVTAAAVEIT